MLRFLERKQLKVKRASHFVKIRVACPHRLPKLPESTQRKEAIPNKGSLFYSHCGVVLVARVETSCFQYFSGLFIIPLFYQTIDIGIGSILRGFFISEEKV
jgi:hypothetical protein